MKTTIGRLLDIFQGGEAAVINGKVSEFVDHIHYGDELIFRFHGREYFLQGFLADDGVLTLYLDRWQPPTDDYIWVGRGDDANNPVEDFLCASIWEGKSFWDIEQESEWIA